MDTTVAKWEAIALPESADEYDEWRPMALDYVARVTDQTRVVAGKLLWFELHYRGEDAYATLRDELAERLDVGTRTLQRWRKLLEDRDNLPPASPKIASAQRAANANASRKARQAERIPTEETEHIAPKAKPDPTPTPPAKPSKQLEFDFTPRLLDVLALIRPEWQDAAAARLEGFVEKMRTESGQRSGDVVSRLKK